MSERLTPLQQATVEVPRRSYEARNPRRWMQGYRIASLAGGVIDVALLATQITHPSVIPTAIIGGTIYAASSAADRISTSKVFRNSQELNKRGIDSGLKEHNPIFTKEDQIEKATVRQFNFHPALIMKDVFETVFSALNIGFAIPVTLGNLHASLNNFRLAKRYKRAAEIHDKQLAV